MNIKEKQGYRSLIQDSWNMSQPNPSAQQVQPPQENRYTILQKLGEGGMGVVYKVHDRVLNRQVALKTLNGNQSKSSIQRFLKEAKAMAKLAHENIVRVYDIGQYNQQYYFTMDFITGKNLDETLKEKKITTRHALEILTKVVRAIDYAHSKGVVHRDLKPANIMISGDGTPYVMDFGLAKEVQGNTKISQTGTILGTPAYMPPEQAKGERRQVDEQSDVYSLGATLYEMLTGRPPFVNPNSYALLLQIVSDSPIPPSELNPCVSKDLEAICLKAIEKSKSHRYVSAKALEEDLENYLLGKSISAQQPSLLSLVSRWGQQNPALVKTITIATLFVVTILVYHWISLNASLAQERKLKEKADKKSQELEEKNQELEFAKDQERKLKEKADKKSQELEEKNQELELAKNKEQKLKEKADKKSQELEESHIKQSLESISSLYQLRQYSKALAKATKTLNTSSKYQATNAYKNLSLYKKIYLKSAPVLREQERLFPSKYQHIAMSDPSANYACFKTKGSDSGEVFIFDLQSKANLLLKISSYYNKLENQLPITIRDHLVGWCSPEGEVKVQNIKQKKILFQKAIPLQQDELIKGITISPNRQYLYCCTSKNAYIWEIATAKKIKQLNGGDRGFLSRFSPDSKEIAYIYRHQNQPVDYQSLSILNLRSNKARDIIVSPSSLCYSHNSKQLIVGSYRILTSYSSASNRGLQKVYSTSESVSPICISTNPKDTVFAVLDANSNIIVYQSSTGEVVTRIPSIDKESSVGKWSAFALKFISNKTLAIWYPHKIVYYQIRKNLREYSYRSLPIDPKEKHYVKLIPTIIDKVVAKRNFGDLYHIFQNSTSIAISPNERYIIFSISPFPLLFDREKQQINVLSTFHDTKQIAFSSDSKFVGLLNNHKLAIWDITDKKQIATMEGGSNFTFCYPPIAKNLIIISRKAGTTLYSWEYKDKQFTHTPISNNKSKSITIYQIGKYFIFNHIHVLHIVEIVNNRLVWVKNIDLKLQKQNNQDVYGNGKQKNYDFGIKILFNPKNLQKNTYLPFSSPLHLCMGWGGSKNNAKLFEE